MYNWQKGIDFYSLRSFFQVSVHFLCDFKHLHVKVLRCVLGLLAPNFQLSAPIFKTVANEESLNKPDKNIYCHTRPYPGGSAQLKIW